MAKLVQEHLEQKGMRILTSKGVEEFLGDTKVTGIMAGGEKIEADLIHQRLWRESQHETCRRRRHTLGETGPIKTNARMETDVKDIYAVGDCAEAPNSITHRSMCAQLGTIAVRQGKVGGANAGGDYLQFKGI